MTTRIHHKFELPSSSVVLSSITAGSSDGRGVLVVSAVGAEVGSSVCWVVGASLGGCSDTGSAVGITSTGAIVGIDVGCIVG